MPETTVSVATPRGRMPVYDARPTGEPAAAVIVVQEAFGVNDHIRDVTRRFAAQGHRAVAPHLFYDSGDPELSYTDFEAVRPHMAALSAAGIEDDLDATIGYLADAGFPLSKIGIVGFCMGGSVALFAAARRPLGAGVTFYGGGVAESRFGMPPGLELARDLQAPWLGLYGDADQSIPVADVERLREVVAGAKVPTEVVRYPEAGHGFHCDQRASYHEASAKDAWQRALEWFRRHLG